MYVLRTPSPYIYIWLFDSTCTPNSWISRKHLNPKMLKMKCKIFSLEPSSHPVVPVSLSPVSQASGSDAQALSSPHFHSITKSGWLHLLDIVQFMHGSPFSITTLWSKPPLQFRNLSGLSWPTISLTCPLLTWEPQRTFTVHIWSYHPSKQNLTGRFILFSGYS